MECNDFPFTLFLFTLPTIFHTCSTIPAQSASSWFTSVSISRIIVLTWGVGMIADDCHDLRYWNECGWLNWLEVLECLFHISLYRASHDFRSPCCSSHFISSSCVWADKVREAFHTTKSQKQDWNWPVDANSLLAPRSWPTSNQVLASSSRPKSLKRWTNTFSLCQYQGRWDSYIHCPANTSTAWYELTITMMENQMNSLDLVISQLFWSCCQLPPVPAASSTKSCEHGLQFSFYIIGCW